MAKTAGIVIIGNEVLSGKTQDINSHFFCTELRQLGVEVQKISTIQDEIELIGKEVAEFSRRFDFVFTSGGIGPTHDDVTIEGIAHGFGVKVVRHPGNRSAHAPAPRRRFERSAAAHGQRARGRDAARAPMRRLRRSSLIRNVYIFPGIPKILQERFHAIKERFATRLTTSRMFTSDTAKASSPPCSTICWSNIPSSCWAPIRCSISPIIRSRSLWNRKTQNYLDQALAAFVASLPKDARPPHRLTGSQWRESSSWGRLPPFKKAPLPPHAGHAALLGPRRSFHGAGAGQRRADFLALYDRQVRPDVSCFLLIPACLLQFPVIYEIGRYTLLTGESIFQGFIRLNRNLAFFLWILMTLSFLWFGAFAAAGGTSIAALTDFPLAGRGASRHLFWAYATMAVISHRHIAQQSNLPT